MVSCYLFLWFTSLNMIISRSIQVAENDIIWLFLWLSNIPLYVYTTSSLSIHVYLGCFHAFSSVQFSRVQLFVMPWTAAHQASLSITNSRSLLKLTSIESMMPSSHLILCDPLLLLPPIPPSNRVFSNESTFGMRWPKYWSFSFSISGILTIYNYWKIQVITCSHHCL